LYEGVKLCQTTLLLEQLEDVSLAFSATPNQKELAFNAEPLLQRERPSAVSTVELLLARRLSKADSVAPWLKPSTEMKRAKPEPNGLKGCVCFVR
jgi:hypothetical protein